MDCVFPATVNNFHANGCTTPPAPPSVWRGRRHTGGTSAGFRCDKAKFKPDCHFNLLNPSPPLTQLCSRHLRIVKGTVRPPPVYESLTAC